MVSPKGLRKMNHEIIKDNKIPKQVEGQHVGMPRVNGRLNLVSVARPQCTIPYFVMYMQQIYGDLEVF